MINDFVERRRRARRRREWESWPADRVIEEYEALVRAIRQYWVAYDTALEARGAMTSESVDFYGARRDFLRSKRHLDQAREAIFRFRSELEAVAHEMLPEIYRAQRREGKVTEGFHSWIGTQRYSAPLSEPLPRSRPG